MSITKRVLLYSVGVISFIMILMIAYFYFMLSPLYVDYVSRERIQTIREIQTAFKKGEDYSQFHKEINDSDLTYSTFQIPEKGYTITLYANGGSIDFNIIDENLRETMDQIRGIDFEEEFKSGDEFYEIVKPYMENTLELLKSKFYFFIEEFESIVTVTNNAFEDEENSNPFKFLGDEFHYIGEMQGIYETQVATNMSYYSNYTGLLKTQSHYYITFGTGVTPKLMGLQPVVVESLPTIFVISICLILAATMVFSRMLLLPMRKLSKIAREIQYDNYQPKEVTETKHDEFSQLEGQLNRSYVKLQESMGLLRESNQQLQEKNKQQKVFLMASSHQLKTPVTSSLLLVDSMMNKIGKFKNYEEYFPILKKEILEMQTIINEILELNQDEISHKSMESVSVKEIVDNSLLSNGLLFRQKDLEEENLCTSVRIHTDPRYFYKIVDNLMKNAINYTPKGGKIKIQGENESLCIINYGVTIEEKLLPQIFEPFVRTTSNVKGHGLGLYIAAHYAKLLGLKVAISNDQKENCVIAIVSWKDT